MKWKLEDKRKRVQTISGKEQRGTESPGIEKENRSMLMALSLSNFLTTVILHSLFTFPNCSLFTFIAIMNDRWICESDRWL